MEYNKLKNKKVLFVSGSSCGGAENVTCQYAQIVKNAGYNSTILILAHPEREILSLCYLPQGMRHIEIKCRRFRNFFFPLFYYIFKESPAIVFAWNPFVVKLLHMIKVTHIVPNFKIIARSPNTPSVMDREEMHSFKFFKYADSVIAQTKEMEEELYTICNISKNKLITINNPIGKEKIKQGILESFKFDRSFVNYVAVGRVAPQKDYLTMLKAFSIVRKRIRKCRLYIVGPANDKTLNEELFAFMQNNDISENVFFEGFQSNPYKYMKNCDCFLLSSIYEGLPNVVLDAIYLAKPVVATSCIPYISQVIECGSNGFTSPVGDYETFANNMIQALEIKNLQMYNDINKSEDRIVELFNKIIS